MLTRSARVRALRAVERNMLRRRGRVRQGALSAARRAMRRRHAAMMRADAAAMDAAAVMPRLLSFCHFIFAAAIPAPPRLLPVATPLRLSLLFAMMLLFCLLLLLLYARAMMRHYAA